MAGSNQQPPALTNLSQQISPDCRPQYYAGLAVSSPVMAETSASTQCTDPGWVAWKISKVTNTNQPG